MSNSGRTRLVTLRSRPVGSESGSTVDPDKLATYRDTLNHLPKQDGCDRLCRGHSQGGSEQSSRCEGIHSDAAVRGKSGPSWRRRQNHRLRRYRYEGFDAFDHQIKPVIRPVLRFRPLGIRVNQLGALKAIEGSFDLRYYPTRFTTENCGQLAVPNNSRGEVERVTGTTETLIPNDFWI